MFIKLEDFFVKFFLNKQFSALVILGLALLPPLFAMESKDSNNPIGFAFHHDGKICVLDKTYNPDNKLGINVELSGNILPELMKVTEEAWGKIEFLQEREQVTRLTIEGKPIYFLPAVLERPDNMDTITAAETTYNLIAEQVWKWLIAEDAYRFDIEILPGNNIRTLCDTQDMDIWGVYLKSRIIRELKAVFEGKSIPEMTFPFSRGSATSYSEYANRILMQIQQPQ